MALPPNSTFAPVGAVDPAIVRSIRQASQASSTDFGLLMAQASAESGFRPDAKAATGTASGLFQFIQSTWLDMMHRFGDKYGVGELAQKITIDGSGQPHVADAAARKRILALRDDPTLSASLAGEYAKLNKDEIEHALGRTARPADLYMAHFLGAGGATQFLKALETKSGTSAARLLPEAAANNHAVFYDAAGRAKSVAEIFHTLGGKIEQQSRDFARLEDPAQTPEPAQLGSAAPAGGVMRRLGTRLAQPLATMIDGVTMAALRIAGSSATPPRAAHHTGRKAGA